MHLYVLLLFKMKLFFWLEELKMFLLCCCRVEQSELGPRTPICQGEAWHIHQNDDDDGQRKTTTGRGRRRQTDNRDAFNRDAFNRDAFNRDAFNRDAFSIIFHVHSVKNGSAAVFVYILGALLCVFEPQLIVL